VEGSVEERGCSWPSEVVRAAHKQSNDRHSRVDEEVKVRNGEGEAERGSGVDMRIDWQRGCSWPSEVVRAAHKPTNQTTGSVE